MKFACATIGPAFDCDLGKHLLRTTVTIGDTAKFVDLVCAENGEVEREDAINALRILADSFAREPK